MLEAHFDGPYVSSFGSVLVNIDKPGSDNRGNSIGISMSSNGAGELQDGDGPDRKKIKTSECVRLVIYTTNLILF